jgi:hypothetical protein
LPPGRATRLRGAGEKKRGFDARVRANVDAAWDSPVAIPSRRISAPPRARQRPRCSRAKGANEEPAFEGAILGGVAHLIGAFALGPVPIE